MKSILLAMIFALVTLAACVVTPGPPGHGGVMVAPLPVIVELGTDRHYYHEGNYYYYDNDVWRYSRSRNGPWTDLPRSYWPKEIKYRKRDDGHHRDQDKDRNRLDDRQRQDMR
jgi:hypothetical protein